jgi:primosomal protein N' (replication factor Y)
MIAEVAVNRPIKKTFDYKVPQELENYIQKGQRVKIRFANRKTIGFVVDIKAKSSFKKLSLIEGLIDGYPLYDDSLLKLTKETAAYYYCAWGLILEAGVPFSLKTKKSLLKEKDLAALKGDSHKKNKAKNNKAGNTLEKGKGAGKKVIDYKGYKPYLLKPQSSKEKFDIYKELIKDMLDLGKKVLILTPDAFNAQVLKEELLAGGSAEAVSERLDLKGRLVSFSSQQSQKENKANHQLLIGNKAEVIIGTRSCIYLNISNLGLIIIDNEDSEFFKRPDNPRYDARLIACLRAQAQKLPLIRVSLSPSLETYYRLKNNEIELIKFKGKKGRPEKLNILKAKGFKDFNFIDLNEEEDITTRKKYISYRLKGALEECLKNKKQAVILFNRRGFASIIKCAKCKEILKCPRCETILNYHYDKKKAVCHKCGYSQELPKFCPECRKDYLRLFGFGTQKLESNLSYMFDEARIERLDLDEASDIKSRFKIIDDFNKGKIDFLIATQIIGPGLDFKNTNTLAVLSLESIINQSDFRGLKKAFSFLCGLFNDYYSLSKKPKVYIQSFLSGFKMLDYLKDNDQASFYEDELELRNSLKLPPYYSINKVHLRSRDKEKVQETADRLVGIFNKKKTKGLLIHPAEPPISLYKTRGSYAADIEIKADKIDKLRKLLDKSLNKLKAASGVYIIPEIESV